MPQSFPPDMMPYPPPQQPFDDCPPPPDSYIPYRGRRVKPDVTTLAVEKISVQTVKHNSGDIVFTVTFNMPINPFSLTGNAVAVNGKSLNGIAAFKYNMYGNEVQISVPKYLIEQDNKTYTVSITKCDSYSGEPLASTHISALEIGAVLQIQPDQNEE